MDTITIIAIAVILIASHAGAWAIGVVQGAYNAMEQVNKKLAG